MAQDRGPRRSSSAAGRGRSSERGRSSRAASGRAASGPDRGAPDAGSAGGPVDRSLEQQRYDGPPIPEEITGRELDRSVAAQLRSLPDKLATRVARHLVAAGLLLQSDPRTAYEHTLAARARAGRLGVVREAVGEAAYAAGEYTEALAELRAARRMNGAAEYLPMMADCERALGRPDRALSLLRSAPKAGLTSELSAELRIVEAGARRDRGEVDAALRTLEATPLTSASRAPWVARLRYAYADTLLVAGRSADALEWFHRAEAVDADEVTDAADRAAEIEKALE